MGIKTITGGQKPKQGDPCMCGSELSYRDCHGDGVKQAICNRIANEMMVQLIAEEKIKKGLICVHGIATGEKCVDCSGPQELNLEN